MNLVQFLFRVARDFAGFLLVTSLGVAAVLFFTGCTKVEAPHGWTYLNVGFQKRIAELDFTATNGARLRLKGYSSDGAELAGAIAEGTARGLAK